LLDRWVIFAPRRAKRPVDYATPRSKAELKVCVFCPRHENLTPPAKLLYVPEDGKILELKDRGRQRRSDWLVRCIPNLYPALSGSENSSLSLEKRTGFPHISRRAIGAHLIIIESPRHDDHPHHASQRQIELWLRAAIDLVSKLERTKYSKSVALFRNHRREAGASIAHAHSQIITTPIIPVRIEQEHRAMKKFQNEEGGCALCRIRATEAKSERKILDLKNFTVFAPWASIFPFEFWIVPKRHSPRIVGLSHDEIKDLSATIQLSFRALANALSDPPYNAIFHQSPAKSDDGAFHWHIEVYPKLSIHAGFELGTGMYINTLKPETAATALASTTGEETIN
jgi:UDPglucose--hexose-1-phosphate uridylyltransferase